MDFVKRKVTAICFACVGIHTCKGDLGQNNKRKERADTYTGEETAKVSGFNVMKQKFQKSIHADDLQNKTLEAVPNMEEANNDGKEATEIKKNVEGSAEKEPELVRIMEELEDFPAFGEYEFDDLDFLPLEYLGHHQEIPLSPQESSNKNVANKNVANKNVANKNVANKNVAGQPQMQTHGPSDEEQMLDGISLADLENDLQEGQGSASDMNKEENQELFDEIYNDLVNELKP